MPTILNRIEAAWATGDPLALHRDVERLAAEGNSQQDLEDALETLLLAVRASGASDDAEEIINGVWDRLTGWCHRDQQIATPPSGGKPGPIDGHDHGDIPASLAAPTTLR
jgi:hypothetical protein